MVRAESYRLHVEWALRQLGINGKTITFRGAANKLNGETLNQSWAACAPRSLRYGSNTRN
jgi:hypothetical protein